jgi:hypothetical protein
MQITFTNFKYDLNFADEFQLHITIIVLIYLKVRRRIGFCGDNGYVHASNNSTLGKVVSIVSVS